MDLKKRWLKIYDPVLMDRVFVYREISFAV